MIFFDWFELFIVFAIGLHIPKAFTLLYCFIAGIAWRRFFRSRAAGPVLLRPFLLWRISLVSILLFSISYVFGMLNWSHWSWQADRADIFNALSLPVLLLCAGLQSFRFGRLWLVRVLVAYSLGSLLFVLIAMGLSRDPWWDLGQLFPSDDLWLPWGQPRIINARSIEQNAIPVFALLPALLYERLRCGAVRGPWLSFSALVLAALGLYSIWSLQGRLGILAVVLACIPFVFEVFQRLVLFDSKRKRFPIIITFVALLSLLLSFRPWRIGLGSVGWSQGFCDERFSLHAAIIRFGWASPWGGRLLAVPYQLCDGASALLAPSGGTVALAHNVLLDVFLDVGLIPLFWLALAVLPLLLVLIQNFYLSWISGGWDFELCIFWGWFVLVLLQWSFQPLLYADGLLYYFSFFVLSGLVTRLNAASEVDIKSVPL